MNAIYCGSDHEASLCHARHAAARVTYQRAMRRHAKRARKAKSYDVCEDSGDIMMRRNLSSDDLRQMHEWHHAIPCHAIGNPLSTWLHRRCADAVDKYLAAVST